MTARQHPLHQDSPAHAPPPQARGAPPVLSQPEPGIEALVDLGGTGQQDSLAEPAR